jgi:hypothetical protein
MVIHPLTTLFPTHGEFLEGYYPGQNQVESMIAIG